MPHVLLFTLGLLLLAVGAAFVVVGAARLDRGTGRSAFAVGLVAVLVGPALAGFVFNLAAVLHAQPRIAMGNIVGSNIFAVGIVLGVAACARPITATARLHFTLVVIAILATLLFWFFARDNRVERWEAGVLLGAFLLAIVQIARTANREPDMVKAEFGSWVPENWSLLFAVALAGVGIASLLGGAALVTRHAVECTRTLAINSYTLGLFGVAAFTSLPALLAVVFAARRGRGDVALAIVVCSLFTNLLFGVGVVAMVRPLLVIEHAILNEVPAMALFAVLLVPVLANGLRVPRREGAVLLAAYAGFIAWQVFGK